MAVDETLPPGEENFDKRPRRFTAGQKIGFGVIGALFFGTLYGAHWLLSKPNPDGAHSNSTAKVGLPFEGPKQPAEVVPAVASPPLPPMPAIARVVPKSMQPATVDPGIRSKISAISAPAGGPAASGGHHSGDEDGEGSGVEDEFSKSLKPSDVGKTAYADVLKNPDRTIPAGTLIKCTLDTAINSQLKGFARCHIPEKHGVWNATGTAIMLDAGTIIIGQIRSGLMHGQNRLMILWTIARTPHQVVANLNSPATDELGRSGVTGVIDNHFWERFGSTLVYSLVGYAPQIINSAIQNKNGNNNTYNNSYQGFFTPQQNLAESVLREEMNVPPVLEKNQGDMVDIFLGHDISFEKVYRFKTLGRSRVLSGD